MPQVRLSVNLKDDAEAMYHDGDLVESVERTVFMEIDPFPGLMVWIPEPVSDYFPITKVHVNPFVDDNPAIPHLEADIIVPEHYFRALLNDPRWET